MEESRPGPPARLVRFGVFEADFDAGEVRKQGRTVRLRGRPIELLGVLLERPGEVVTREALRQRLWSSDTFVDFDHGLNTAVNRLREALGDAADNPRFVETVPRRGYRFIAPVLAEALAPPAEPPTQAVEERVRPAAGRRPTLVRAGLVIAALAVLGALGLSLLGKRRPSAGGPVRIAVLPFDDLGDAAGSEHFADGLTEALITDLARIRGLRVISRTSVMAYAGTKKPLPQIARELGVDMIVEGSAQRSEGRVRITAQLIEAGSDRHLWADSYDRDLRDVLALERDVARAIAREVRVALTAQEQARLQSAGPVDPRAHEAYLRGRFLREKLTADSVRRAIGYYEEAIRLDPGFAPAYAGLADAYLISGSAGYELMPPGEAAPRAKAAARMALDRDPTIAAAQATLAAVTIEHDWDFAEGDRLLRDVLAENPSFAKGHVWYSSYLAAQGKTDEALLEAQRGRELDPLSQTASQTLGVRYYDARRFDDARAEFSRTLELDPKAFVARLGLAQTHWQQGRRHEALAELKRAVEDSEESPYVLGWLGYARGAAGDPAGAREVLARLESLSRTRYVSSFYSALVHSGLGDRAAALDELERAFTERSSWMVFLNVERAFDGFREDPRFRDLVRRVGLGR